jgi:hypothetical protein
MRVRRLAILFTLAIALVPLAARGQNDAAKLEFFTGKVVPLAALLDKEGVKLDGDATLYWLALVTDEGRVHPIIKDSVGRMFYKDKQLHNRPMRITGRVIPKSDLLQAINVHSLKNGVLHDVYYWCEVCIIRGLEAGVCDCCGAPMEFREIPVKK